MSSFKLRIANTGACDAKSFGEKDESQKPMKSSGNGKQRGQSIREGRPASNKLQAQIDRALGLADREIGIQESGVRIPNSGVPASDLGRRDLPPENSTKIK